MSLIERDGYKINLSRNSKTWAVQVYELNWQSIAFVRNDHESGLTAKYWFGLGGGGVLLIEAQESKGVTFSVQEQNGYKSDYQAVKPEGVEGLLNRIELNDRPFVEGMMGVARGELVFPFGRLREGIESYFRTEILRSL